jgi:aryl-alcohol dehydrogenase-like predicted oxidoreductase
MKYRRLGRTGLHVSALCLGTMQFGWTADERAAFAVMDAFVAAGGTFLDTADIYSAWVEGNPGGVSEEIIGRWMQQRGNRHDLVIATKGRGRMWAGPNGEGLSRVHLIRAVDDSLRRLQTDYIDLYQTHWFDAATPIEETLGTLDDLIRVGKIRYIGCSNIPVWRLMQALWASDRLRLARYDSLQPHYNLAYRAEFEPELQPVCLEYGLGVMPYSALASGFLTGKYRRDTPPPTSDRAARIQQRYCNEQGWRIIDALDQIAHTHSVPMSQVALAWLLARPGMTAPIIGANSVEQLQDLLDATELSLDAAAIAALDNAGKPSDE